MKLSLRLKDLKFFLQFMLLPHFSSFDCHKNRDKYFFNHFQHVKTFLVIFQTIVEI